MSAATQHRLDGLEPDNLLAFLALLGLLRALESGDRERPEDDRFRPRVAWDVDNPPVRPALHLACPATRDQVAQAAAEGVADLARGHEFRGLKDLTYSRNEARSLLRETAEASSVSNRNRVDLLAALFTDAAVKKSKNEEVIEPTPFCLMFGQGHQHFLERLAKVPLEAAPPPRGRGKQAVRLTASECLAEALFAPWHRSDPTISFRWDPEEDVRYALLAGNPTAPAYKAGTQHGASRLAAVGLAVFTVVPRARGGRVRTSVVGTESSREGRSVTWPIWREPATLDAIRGLLNHPGLRNLEEVTHLGIDHVMEAQRISVGKFMNFSRARPTA